MKFKVVQTIAAAAAVLLIAGCGGGGGSTTSSTPTPTPTPSLELSGTAATGAALAGATVQVKCAGGSGNGTTTSTGAYTISISGGTLPCIIQVSGSAGGVAVTLHSVTESGTTDSSTAKTSAVANVTPVTEMIVAQLTAALPSDSFSSFDASKVTSATVASAATAIVDALKNAGVDLGSIDPLKATLVPANGSTAGNAYDKLLDLLASKVPPASLPQVVNQIATSGGLTQAMTAVSGGFLEGCPSILSGKFRTLDLFGKTVVRDIDFAKKTFTAANGTDLFAISTDSAKPCEFTVTGTSEGKDVEWNVAMGANGVGAYRARFTNPASPGTNGYIFPAQSHPMSAVAGTWNFVQSGYLPGDGVDHFGGQLTLNGSGTVSVCDYDESFNCVIDTGAGLTLTARTDGGFDLNEPGQSGVAQLYGYKAPSGALAVFGTTNAAGASGTDVAQTSIFATKVTTTTAVPALNTVTKYWDVGYTRFASTTTALAPIADSHTVISVDGKTVQRKRASDSREDTVRYDSPVAGMRTRDAGVWNSVPYAKVYQLPLQGMGVTISVNALPVSSGATFIHNISVIRP